MTNQRHILALLFFALLTLSVISFAHGDEASSAPPLAAGGTLTPINETANNSSARLIVSAFPLQAAVPRLSEFTLQAENENGSALEHVAFEVKLVQTEDDKVVFATTLHDHEGVAKFSYGFNDGSEHRLEVTAIQMKEDNTTQVAAPVHHEYLIDVEPQQPTLALQARVFSGLLIVFGFGALVGRWFGGRQHSKKAHHAQS